MFQRILVATDGSAMSEEALKTALQLAQEQKAELLIVHVVDMYGFYLASADVVRVFHEEGEAILSRAEDTARQAGVSAKTRLLETGVGGSRVAELIAEEGKTWPADLLVVGTHGRRGLSRLFLGSVAEGVSRLATVPVLLVRAPAS